MKLETSETKTVQISTAYNMSFTKEDLLAALYAHGQSVPNSAELCITSPNNPYERIVIGEQARLHLRWHEVKEESYTPVMDRLRGAATEAG